MGSIETGSIISRIRKEKKMTQKELAQLLNVSDKAVSKWERGESYPDVGSLPLIADILDISIDELLGSEKVSNKDIAIDNQLSYQYLLEDCEQQFDKNWFYSYCLMAFAMFMSFISLPYNISEVFSILLALFSIGLFYFFDKKYQVSMNRYQYYINSSATLQNRKPYYQMLLTVATQCILIIMISSLNNNYIKNGMVVGCYSNYFMLLFAYTADVDVLWSVFIKHRDSIDNINKKIIINSIVNFLLCIGMIFFKIFINLSRHVEAIQYKFDIFIIIIFMLILVIFGFTFSFRYLNLGKCASKDRKKLYLIITIQNLMIVSAFMSVTFRKGGLHNKIYYFIYLDRLILILLASVICYYLSNIIYKKLTINNEGDLN